MKEEEEKMEEDEGTKKKTGEVVKDEKEMRMSEPG